MKKRYLHCVPIFMLLVGGSMVSVCRAVSSSTLRGNSTGGNMTETFKYFAFGSNLLGKRIHINNPSAKRYDIGLLKDYRLDFGYFSERWKGYAATVVPQVGKHVWGVIYDVGAENRDSLDEQEGVQLNIYERITVKVTTPKGEEVECLSYSLVHQPDPPKVPGVPNNLPSTVYMRTIINGAKENKLPEDYVKQLEATPTNGYDGPVFFDSN